MTCLLAGAALVAGLSGCSGASGRDAAAPAREGGLIQVGSGETIYVRRAGRGAIPVVLLPGNNCSGGSFEALLALVEETPEIREAYTFHAFDYRGSGGSSYHHAVETLEDFAYDFADVIAADPLLREGNITLVGHSMGFGVAQLLACLDPERISGLVSLAGIGTRGVRVLFAGDTVGTDPATGKTYSAGDWADGLAAVAFQQRTCGGENRTVERVKAVWNGAVFNEVLEIDPRADRVGDSTYLEDPGYEAVIADVLETVTMPESLYACHRFNASDTAVSHTNRDGAVVIIPGTDRLGGVAGKPVLLVKAKTARAMWRGDLVIDDSITRNTKADLRHAGATVTAVLPDPNTGYDHGFPIRYPRETLYLITAFAESGGSPDAERLDEVFGPGTYALYGDEETAWEKEAYGGF